MLNCLFVWFIIIRMPSSVLSVFFLSSFSFSSSVHHPRFYLSFVFLHLVSQLLDTILDSKLNCLFLWFLNIPSPSFDVCSIGLSSQGHYPRFYLCLLFVFPSLGHHPRLYLSLNISSFHFSSKGMHPRLNLSFFCLHLVSQHWDTILGSIKFLLCYFGFSLLGHHPMFYLSLFFFHLDARHYLCFFPFPLVCHHWYTIPGSILVFSFFSYP